jgi:Polyketide cyclase / dehydrase and lipid transport
MGKKIALALVAGLALLAAIIALQPASFSVERSAVIEAPPGIVIAHIENLRAMDAWSPWARMDAKMKIAYQGPEAGVGARSSWEGPEMGKGRLTITAVKPDERVEMKLEMLAPMQATNRIVFSLVPLGAATEVTWRMDGTQNFIGKALSLVIDMDEMVGVPFEKGLAALKGVAESEAAGR